MLDIANMTDAELAQQLFKFRQQHDDAHLLMQLITDEQKKRLKERSSPQSCRIVEPGKTDITVVTDPSTEGRGFVFGKAKK